MRMKVPTEKRKAFLAAACLVFTTLLVLSAALLVSLRSFGPLAMLSTTYSESHGGDG
ncbi:hypothetical protein EV184_12654 [Sinorhizobium americanum]|jgi:hypothetical protein|uniref:Uncharacterized protein n=1 Tax=Sinorhizobium americanum TaxID=194963 RepID=A0A4R2B3T3_9HYPH|nr:hypothetical protein EV184_12654 [Sinorhizobium americanum]